MADRQRQRSLPCLLPSLAPSPSPLLPFSFLLVLFLQLLLLLLLLPLLSGKYIFCSSYTSTFFTCLNLFFPLITFSNLTLPRYHDFFHAGLVLFFLVDLSYPVKVSKMQLLLTPHPPLCSPALGVSFMWHSELPVYILPPAPMGCVIYVICLHPPPPVSPWGVVFYTFFNLSSALRRVCHPHVVLS